MSMKESVRAIDQKKNISNEERYVQISREVVRRILEAYHIGDYERLWPQR